MNLVLLYSGGLESRFLLDLAIKLQYHPFCVLVDYGQNHVEELKKAVEVCETLQIPYTIIRVDWNINSKLTGSQKETYDGVSQWYVPARNLLFISLAAGVAESMQISTIWIGASYSDRVNRFPDTTQDFIVSINETLAISLSTSVQVVAPLLGMPKELITRAIQCTTEIIINNEIFSGYGNNE